jgi:hypothetical protein
MRVLLSASPKVQTDVLRGELRELGAEVVATTEVGSGGRLAGAIHPGDRLLAVVQGPQAGNAAVLVEIGIAIGMGLPILIVAAPGSVLPSILNDVFIVRTLPGDSHKLSLALKIFLRSDPAEPARHATGRSTQPGVADFRKKLATLESAGLRRGADLESFAADLFRQLGAQVEERRQLGGGPDLAISIPGEEWQLGTVLVELKYGDSQRLFEDAASMLQRHVLNLDSGLGLLLYTGPEKPSKTWPMVVVLSFRRFLAELENASLARVLVRARNEAIHNL